MDHINRIKNWIEAIEAKILLEGYQLDNPIHALLALKNTVAPEVNYRVYSTYLKHKGSSDAINNTTEELKGGVV